MSVAGFREYLGVSDNETLMLWKKGYVNREHVDSDEWTHNKALSEAVSRGITRVGRCLLETECGKYMSRIRERQAESIGELLPTKVINEITTKVTLGKFDKFSN